MSATARLLQQRSSGHVALRMGQHGVKEFREAGSAKCRIPRDSHEAILINVSGGLAGGDIVGIDATVDEDAALTLTTQAAERVYRTLGPAAQVDVKLEVAARATLLWLPQETIFFEGSRLKRTLHVDIEEDANFLAVEPMVFGRGEMGETVKRVIVQDKWQVCAAGKLVHMEAFRLGPGWSANRAAFDQCRAAATLLYVTSKADRCIEEVRAALGPQDGASAWNGKLVARLVAPDGFQLRKRLVQVICACVGAAQLPRCWSY